MSNLGGNVAFWPHADVLERLLEGKGAATLDAGADDLITEFVALGTKDDCGPTNNWAEPKQMREEMQALKWYVECNNI